MSKEHGNKRHGLSGTRFYRSWYSMKERCRNPKDINYHRYGGRGISYCMERELFDEFYKDMFDSYKDGLTLDRVDTNGNYRKGNCKWSTPLEQANNTRNTKHITIDGVTKNQSERQRHFGVSNGAFRRRINNGRDYMKALTTPSKK